MVSKSGPSHDDLLMTALLSGQNSCSSYGYKSKTTCSGTDSHFLGDVVLAHPNSRLSVIFLLILISRVRIISN